VTAADFETVPAPDAGVPGWTLPPDACDAHFHVFGPYDRFPPAARPVYALPDATPQVAATLRRTLGLTRGVLVQPTRPMAAIPMPC
jgi:predicted TIM-barrel fold metal-dependent hydrolase